MFDWFKPKPKDEDKPTATATLPRDVVPKSTEYRDKTITCSRCGRDFIFHAGEAQFYAEKELSEPKRCPPCRQARRVYRNDGGSGW